MSSFLSKLCINPCLIQVKFKKIMLKLKKFHLLIGIFICLWYVQLEPLETGKNINFAYVLHTFGTFAKRGDKRNNIIGIII